MPRDLKTIISEVDARLRGLFQEAFEAGRDAGRAEAASELRGKLADILSEPGASIAPSSRRDFFPPVSHIAPSEGRSAPGTVKPVILRLLRDSRHGLTSAEIVAQTGFKKNSVRGTLHSLKTVDHAIGRIGDRWVALAQKIEAAGEVPKQDTPAASD